MQRGARNFNNVKSEICKNKKVLMCCESHSFSTGRELRWWRRGGRAAYLQDLCLKAKFTRKWEFSLYLLAEEHFWSFAIKRHCSVLLNNRSRWKLDLKTSLEALRSQIDFKWCNSHPWWALRLVLTVLAQQLRWKSLLKATTSDFDILLILETKAVVFPPSRPQAIIKMILLKKNLLLLLFNWITCFIFV